MDNIDEFISITYEEYSDNENNDKIDDDYLLELDNLIKDIHDDNKVPLIVNYNENYTIKELLLICEYYGFLKEIKSAKCNKAEIIEVIVDFETDPSNEDIVFRRQNMWFYINELKQDKFMKKYILW